MDTYQGRNLTKAIGYYGAMAGVGASLGLVLGGAVCRPLDLANRLLH